MSQLPSERLRLEVAGDALGPRTYRFPADQGLSDARTRLVESRFSRLRDHHPEPPIVVYLERIDWKRMIGGGETAHTLQEQYSIPDGWGVEQVRDWLRDLGFTRIDNRQDDPSEPHAFD